MILTPTQQKILMDAHALSFELDTDGDHRVLASALRLRESTGDLLDLSLKDQDVTAPF